MSWVDGEIAKLRGAPPPPQQDATVALIAGDADLTSLPLLVIEAEMTRLESLISADRDIQRRYSDLTQKITIETAALEAAKARLTEAQGAADRIKTLNLERDAAYERAFAALVAEQTLGLKFRRSAVAREILGDVGFADCPRCTQSLPARPARCCEVCGQDDRLELTDATEQAALELDIASRRADLDSAIEEIDRSLTRIRLRRERALDRKASLETARNRASEEADSAFLSTVLLKERERAALEAELQSLAWLLRLPDLLQQQRDALAQIIALELTLKEALKDARTSAEADRTSLTRLGDYFLDALVQSGVPGIQPDDRVALEPPTFYPAVFSSDPSDLTASTFTSMSSGGKKTLFKCCFAIAVHRIAALLDAPLPELLIIDSPMKNISERENKTQFEGFYRMVYALKAGELSETQIILIDKEYLPPDPALGLDIRSRHMQPDSTQHEPLIRYYRGK